MFIATTGSYFYESSLPGATEVRLHCVRDGFVATTRKNAIGKCFGRILIPNVVGAHRIHYWVSKCRGYRLYRDNYNEICQVQKYCEKLVRAGKPQSNDDKLNFLPLSASFGVRDTNDRLNIAEMCCLTFLCCLFRVFRTSSLVGELLSIAHTEAD